MNSGMLNWALLYGTEGFAVFPLHTINEAGFCTCSAAKDCQSPGKHPQWDVKLLHDGLWGASTDESKIRAWWAKWPNANIGIATGQASGIMVLDVDGPAGKESLRELQLKCGRLPRTLAAKTGKGGHLFFKVGTSKYKNKTGVMPGLDIRGDGGYIVAAPSRHINGKLYSWWNNAKIVTPPMWLRQMLTERQHPAKPISGSQAFDRPARHVRIEDIPEEGEGGRNNFLAKWGGRWVYEDLPHEKVNNLLHSLNKARCKPPLGDREVEGVFRSVTRPRYRRVATAGG